MGGKGSGRTLSSDVIWIPDAKTESFERQSTDTDLSWEAFVLYRDAGASRTLELVANQLGKSESQTEKWSARHHWRTRVEDYDRHEDKRQREAYLRQREKQARDMAKTAESLWRLAAKGSIAWHKKFDDWLAEVEKLPAGAEIPDPPMSASEVLRLAEAGIKLHRLVQGDATEIFDVSERVSDDDKRARMRNLISDPKVRAAMRTIAKAQAKAAPVK